MNEYIHQMLAGPGALRFVIQPTIAIVLGVWHGASSRERGGGLRAIALPLSIALAASVVFQYLVQARVRPILALLYAAIFVALPYFAARVLASRVATARRRRRSPTGRLRPAT
jgi:hypothetical protein